MAFFKYSSGGFIWYYGWHKNYLGGSATVSFKGKYAELFN